MRIMLLVLCVAIALATGVVASAAAPAPSGTIAISPSTPGPYAFGELVEFATSAANLKGNQYPLVYVECYSVVDNTLLYGQLDHPDVAFLLGGGSSQWHQQRDDATCLAHLYAYGGREKGVDTIVELAALVSFGASG